LKIEKFECQQTLGHCGQNCGLGCPQLDTSFLDAVVAFRPAKADEGGVELPGRVGRWVEMYADAEVAACASA
jgi:hypothetical protein